MRARDFIIEAQRNRVILVDFQPVYGDMGIYDYDEKLENVIAYINQRAPHVLVFFNGDEVGIEDSPSSIQEHFIEHGLDPRAQLDFRGKGYGFLRSWMDAGINSNAIIATIREMMRQRVTDSRGLFSGEGSETYPQEMQQFLGGYFNPVVLTDPIYIPEISIAELKTFSNALMGGGGRHECFKELKLLMSAFNIRGKEVNDWIYS
jgi:hypothetical protein